MIKELFLACALALPSTFSNEPLTLGDINTVRILARFYRIPPVFAEKKRLLMIGGPEAWLDSFRGVGLESWRITPHPQGRYDIISSVFDQPIAYNSMVVIISLISGPTNLWGSMGLLSQCLHALKPYGYFLFNTRKMPNVERFLLRLGYSSLPFKWHGLSIYSKIMRAGA
jgi:hypothetical protein